jgi:hypothetical protein
MRDPFTDQMLDAGSGATACRYRTGPRLPGPAEQSGGVGAETAMVSGQVELRHHLPADWKVKSLGVTDIGSGTDELTVYLAARYHVTIKEVINLATTSGARQWLGGAYPDANAEGAGIRGPHAARSQFPTLGQEKTPRLPGPRRSW